jgi:hypothetical protein
LIDQAIGAAQYTAGHIAGAEPGEDPLLENDAGNRICKNGLQPVATLE